MSMQNSWIALVIIVVSKCGIHLRDVWVLGLVMCKVTVALQSSPTFSKLGLSCSSPDKNMMSCGLINCVGMEANYVFLDNMYLYKSF